MRESRTFAQRTRVLLSDEVRKKYFLVYEGSETEALYFEQVKKKCREKGFGFYITNPCFEFWLLMHFDEVFRLDKEKLLENSKVITKRRYTEQELRKLLPNYRKSKYDTKTLIGRIDKAIENEKEFCENVELLEHTVGSNIGLLIEEMRQ